jgi:lipopolysaccharide export system ATP-binding protein
VSTAPPESPAGPVRVLSVEHLEKTYNGRRVVDDVSLSVHSGKVVGLLGPNGAGKTTTFYMVVGLAHPDRGQVLLDGQDITHYPMYRRARRGIGYLPQEPSVFTGLSVEENLLAILQTLALSRQEKRERLEALLDELGLKRLRREKARTLSGGERRRLEITRALVTQPSFILLDEPFAGIDPKAVTDIQSIVGHLRDKGIGILITDHNVRETLAITDHAFIINEGKILEAGDADTIANSPTVRKFYLGDHFRL